MYLHLGQNTVVPSGEIVGVFDLDTTTISEAGRRFLTVAQQSGGVVDVTDELPKSFVITCQKNKNGKKNGDPFVYISQMASSTLKKRAESR